MFKYEIHCHTNLASICGHKTPAQQVDFYKAADFTGLVITEHFFNGNCSISNRLPWRERVDAFCRSYEEASARGKEVGLDVFFGFELSYHGTDFVVYGLDREWLYMHPYCDKYSASEFATVARENGAFVTQAHPFREAGYIEMISLLPRHVDAVETLNANRTDFENSMAEHYADSYGLTKVAGSDNHGKETQTRIAAILLDEKAESIFDITNAIRENRHKIAIYQTEELLKGL